MAALVRVVDAARGLIFDEQLVEDPNIAFTASRLEGVWWLPSRSCDVRLVLSNTTDAALTVRAEVSGGVPRSEEALGLTLSPHETRVVENGLDLMGIWRGAPDEVSGISVTHSGGRGALLGRLLFEESATGYSAVAELVDPREAKSSELHGAGLRLGSAGGAELTPIIVARNVGDSNVSLTGRIPYTLTDGSAGVVPLARVRLAPARRSS